MSTVCKDTKPIIVKATPADINKVWEIINECSKWLSTQGMNHWTDYYSERLVSNKLKAKEVYLLFSQGKSVATISLSEIAPLYYHEKLKEKELNYIDQFQEPKAKALYITALGVLPTHQGKGYAKKLMSFAEQKAVELEIRYIRFDVRSSYTKLVEFYKQLGYSIVGEIPDPESTYYLFEKEIV